MPTEQRDVRPELDFGSLRKVPPKDYLLRFVFGASVSIAAALISGAVGKRFGGIFLAFPAILPASLTLLQQEEGTREADRDAIGAILGGLGLAFFAAAGEGLFGRMPGVAVLAVILIVWLAVSLLLYWALAALNPDACDKNQDG